MVRARRFGELHGWFVAGVLGLCAWLAFPAACWAQAAAQSEAALDATRAALEQAKFAEAKARAAELLARSDLSPRLRNAALELAAIIDVAERDEQSAQAKLSELFARDPEHPRRVRDPGPAIETAFARAAARKPPPIEAKLSAEITRDEAGRPSLRVQLFEGREAVETVHAFAWYPDLAEPVELVAHPELREVVALRLPAPEAAASELPVVVEARSPGGYVLGRLGEPEHKALLPLPEGAGQESCKSGAAPLRRAWWLWTGVAIVAAGIAVSAGVVAQ